MNSSDQRSGLSGSLTHNSIRNIFQNEPTEGEFKKLSKDHLDTLKQHQKDKRTARWSSVITRFKRKTKKDSSEDRNTLENIDSQDAKPDETLTGGCVLPEYFGTISKKLLNEPIEDIDPYYKEKYIQTFCVISKRFSKKYIFRFSARRSLFLLSPFNAIRRFALKIAVNQLFDYLVMITIIINCVFMSLDQEYPITEYIFTGLYTIEMIIKVVARGFMLDQFTYLRDPWNWLDIIVIVLSYVTIITTHIQNGSGNFNVSGLRAFRVFRAFKSLNIVPGLRTIVNSLLTAFRHLAEVMLIMMFLLVVVSLIALQAYQGVLTRKCVIKPPLNISDLAYHQFVNNQSNWNPVEGELVVCGNSTTTGFCPVSYICLQDIGGNPNDGYTNFDNFGFAMLTSFQLFTLDYWENVYNLIIRAEGALNILFFIMSVFLGPFYLLNLLLAVVSLAYENEHEEQVKLRQQRAEDKRRARLKVLRRRKLLALRQHSLHNLSDVATVAIINQIQSNPASPKSINRSYDQAIANGNSEDRIVDGTLQVPTESTSGSPSHILSPFSNRSSFRAKREQFQNGQIDSLESGDSRFEDKTKLEKKMKELQDWYLKTFCAWKCFPAFTNFRKKYLIKVIQSNIFEMFIVVCIITNTVFLAMDYHGISSTLINILNIGNIVFTGIFACEAALKMTALGVRGYFKDKWNIFDFFIVAISLIELVLPSSDSGLSVFRTMRLLRVFRLAKIWETMNRLMNIIGKSVSAVGYLTIILFLILFSFAIIGKQLYRDKYENGASKFDDNLVPRWRFTDFYHSFFLVWRVMCGEWIEPLYDCLKVADYTCIPLFLGITLIANFLVLNLFTAILLEAFSVENIKKKNENKTPMIKKGIEGFKNLISKKKKSISPTEAATMTTTADTDTTHGKDTTQATITTTTTTPVRRGSRTMSPSSSLEVPSLSSSEASDSNRLTSSSGSMFALNKATIRKRPSLSPRAMIKYPSLSTDSVGTMSDSSTTSKLSDEVKTFPRRKGTLTRQFSETESEIPKNLVSSSEPNMVSTVIEKIEEEDAVEEEINKAKVSFVTDSSRTDNEISTKPQNGRIVGLDQNNLKEEVSETKSSSCFSCLVCCSSKVSVREDLNEEEGKTKDETEHAPDCFPKCCHCVLMPGPGGHSWMRFRRVANKVANHWIFEWSVLFLILASTVSLAMEDVYLKNDPVKMKVLEILEFIFTSLFTLEMIVKWFGFGLHKYFTNWWCILDAIIVTVSWISIGAAASSANINSLRAIRTLRALRPLRAVSRWQGMKVVVNALIYCIPSIGNVLLVCLLIWLVFSILGVQFFKGQFSKCLDAGGNLVDFTIVSNKTECLEKNLTWHSSKINFDNPLNGMLALFQVATFEGWIEVMADASDVNGVDNQPIREKSYISYLYFFVFVLVGSFFILNLIVGVIIESFQKLRKENDAPSAMEAFLTDNQKAFYETMRNMLNRKPKKTIPQPNNILQQKVFRVVLDNKFEVAIFSVIVMNMLTLAMEHYNMSDTWRKSLSYVDITFTSIFSVEAFLKIFGLRLYYFRDPFNVFDLIVVVMSIAGFVLEELLTFMVSPTLLRVVRVFRVFRVLRVVRAARGIRRLIMTLMMSLPALVNIAVLLLLFMVIFAILGMSFFMEVKLDGALNDQVNFQTFGNSILLLFRLMTSAGWNDVLDPLMNQEDCGPTDCVTNTTTGVETCTGPTNCGNYLIAVFYFLAYIFLVFLVIVNMYIAIILETFENIFRQEESGVSPDDFEFFYLVWGRYDPKASQFVSLAALSNLLHDLHPPFRLPKPNGVKIAALNLPIVNGDKVHCLDVLYALVRRILGEVDIPENIREEAEKKLFKSFPSRKQLKAETTTLVLRQRTKSAKIIQDAWRTFAKARKRSLENYDGDYLSVKTPSPLDVKPERLLPNIASALQVGLNISGGGLGQNIPPKKLSVKSVVHTPPQNKRANLDKKTFSIKALTNISHIPTAVAMAKPTIKIDPPALSLDKTENEENDEKLFEKVDNQAKYEEVNEQQEMQKRPQTAADNSNNSNIKTSSRPKTSVAAIHPNNFNQTKEVQQKQTFPANKVEENKANSNEKSNKKDTLQLSTKENKTKQGDKLSIAPVNNIRKNIELNASPKLENGQKKNNEHKLSSKSVPNIAQVSYKVDAKNDLFYKGLPDKTKEMKEAELDKLVNNNNKNEKFELQTMSNNTISKPIQTKVKPKQESLV